MRAPRLVLFVTSLYLLLPLGILAHDHAHHGDLKFDVRSVQSGNWSDAKTWQDGRAPKAGDRVLVARGTTVIYDVADKQVIRLLQVVGTLRFAVDRDTELNAALVKVQDSDTCSEAGFACDLPNVNAAGEPQEALANKALPTLEVGTLEKPLPAKYTAKIRLHYLEGMNKDDAPALVCCSGRLELHGAPMSRTWVKLGAAVAPGDQEVTLAEPVAGWRVGDEVIVTGSKKVARQKDYLEGELAGTEQRRITKIDGPTVTLDKPLAKEHYGTGDFRSEVANLSRNVIVESADPAGVRGHTLYHSFSQGGLSYAQFSHLGKKDVLGRYAIHFHLVGDTMRGSQVLGVSVVDSHNRWITIHGTEYLVVRDCVGYRSIGHGYFMEDGSEVYNLLDRNLGVQSLRGKKLPKQVLPFDNNEGAAFWWANGRNTLTRNVACENDIYGYRYDMQHSKYFNSTIPVTMPDGKAREVDVRTIGIWRFEDNESHSEGLAGMVVACNGDRQPDTPIRDQKMLDTIKAVDWTGPDTSHPHVIRNLTIWEAHYAFRPHSPSMLIDGLRIHKVAYGVYRPAFDNQVYRNVHLSQAGGEPFNRGMDDASAQNGVITVDGFRVDDVSGNQRHPVVHMSDNNLTGRAAGHFRNVVWANADGRRAVFNRGGSVRADQYVDEGVPYYIHDYYGAGRHAKIVSTAAKNLVNDGNQYRQEPPLTGDESVVAEVKDVAWPELLTPVDDLPPATVITSMTRQGDKLLVTGITHDNGTITGVTVNGKKADCAPQIAGVVDWKIELPAKSTKTIEAAAADNAGNKEQTGHRRAVE